MVRRVGTRPPGRQRQGSDELVSKTSVAPAATFSCYHRTAVIVAIHNHMIDEKPRIVFLHFWGKGPAEGLATGIRDALETQQK